MSVVFFMLKIPSTKISTVTKKSVIDPAKDKRVYVRLLNSHDETILTTLKQIIDEFSGPTEVVLVLGENDRKQIIKLPSGMIPSDDAISKLRAALGNESVVVQ